MTPLLILIIVAISSVLFWTYMQEKLGESGDQSAYDDFDEV